MTGSLLTDIGAGAGALLALLTLVTLMVKSRPCRWLWRRNVSQPLSSWFRGEVSHVVEPPLADLHGNVGDLRADVAEVREQLRPNGGKTLRDRVDRLEVGQGELGVKVDAIESRLARWEREGEQ